MHKIKDTGYGLERVFPKELLFTKEIYPPRKNPYQPVPVSTSGSSQTGSF